MTKKTGGRPPLVPAVARVVFAVAAPARPALRCRVCGFLFDHHADIEAFSACTADARDTLQFQIATAPAWPATVWARLQALVESFGGELTRPA